jgi:hypothetical protein
MQGSFDAASVSNTNKHFFSPSNAMILLPNTNWLEKDKLNLDPSSLICKYLLLANFDSVCFIPDKN